jgi:hypothetical protein
MFGSNQQNTNTGFGFGTNANQGTSAFGTTNTGTTSAFGSGGTTSGTSGYSFFRSYSDSTAFGGGSAFGQRPAQGMSLFFELCSNSQVYLDLAQPQPLVNLSKQIRLRHLDSLLRSAPIQIPLARLALHQIILEADCSVQSLLRLDLGVPLSVPAQFRLGELQVRLGVTLTRTPKLDLEAVRYHQFSFTNI